MAADGGLQPAEDDRLRKADAELQEDRLERREAARARIAREKPMFRIGSPMCTAFSAWQHLNRERRDPALMQREYNKAMIRLEFVCKLYRDQADARRYFLDGTP